MQQQMVHMRLEAARSRAAARVNNLTRDLEAAQRRLATLPEGQVRSLAEIGCDDLTAALGDATRDLELATKQVEESAKTLGP